MQYSDENLQEWLDAVRIVSKNPQDNKMETRRRECRDCGKTIDWQRMRVRCMDCYLEHVNRAPEGFDILAADSSDEEEKEPKKEGTIGKMKKVAEGRRVSFA
jgi:hypothetical protein